MLSGQRGPKAAPICCALSRDVAQPDSLGDLTKTTRELFRIDAVGRHYRTNERIGERIGKCRLELAVHSGLPCQAFV
jgi:hypothetical protein